MARELFALVTMALALVLAAARPVVSAPPASDDAAVADSVDDDAPTPQFDAVEGF